MESMYLLVPISAALVLAIIGVFGWALHKGQFEDLEREGERILQDLPAELDSDQATGVTSQRESPAESGHKM
jgi:cbb3-type cytochrome oxidase maturation protein